MLGTIIRGLHESCLWPIPKEENRIMLAPDTGMRQFLVTLESHMEPFRGHDCGASSRNGILCGIARSVKPQFKNTHMQHCVTQSSKSGLN